MSQLTDTESVYLLTEDLRHEPVTPCEADHDPEDVWIGKYPCLGEVRWFARSECGCSGLVCDNIRRYVRESMASSHKKMAPCPHGEFYESCADFSARTTFTAV